MPHKNYCHYAASKAGVVSLTKSTAMELASQGIRCNVVLPGVTQTAINADAPKDKMENYCKSFPLGRIGQPAG